MPTVEVLTVTQNLGDYDAGDIIDVRPEGFQWGRKELEREDIFEILVIESQVPIHVLKNRIGSLIFECEACGELLDGSEEHDHPELTVIDDKGNAIRAWNIAAKKNRQWRVSKAESALKQKKVLGLSISEEKREDVTVQKIVKKADRPERP
jgi:hypothetical protein